MFVTENAAHKTAAMKADVQAELAVNAARDAGIEIGVARQDDGSVDFLHHASTILVRDAYLDRVEAVVGGGQPTDGLINGVTVYSLDGAEISDVTAALEEIDRRLGIGVATPNHALSITPAYGCPATEPEEVPEGAKPDPAISRDGGGDGVFIYVPDTGLLDDASTHPWLAGVRGEPDPLPGPSSEGVQDIPEYTGHGTFVAGVARCVAPQAEVQIVRDFRAAGVLLEADIVKRLDQALNLGPDVINLSAGGTSRNDLPLLGFEAFWERYRHYKGVVLVAAAGNNGDRRPFWPAAFPHVVSVGSLASNWRSRASFTCYGPWVDVYAPGEGLVNAYATGTYICREPPHTHERRRFEGMARWSGTSFSTPVVSGLIAARISRTGENGRQAADALLAMARAEALPGVGPVLHPA
jgi:subtilisin family serine protease